ncbi:MAG: aldehyde dehydrogenase family protein, partial [Planctomycetota bacterium]
MSTKKIVNPATGEVITEVPFADRDALEATIATARQAFDGGPWRWIPLSDRGELLMRISRGILDNAQELATLETENTGKPIKETTFMDVPSSAETFAYFAGNLERYLESTTIRLESGAESVLLYEPRGVVALIVPWNYPLLIASWKMAQALAAGNTVILKPSGLTPLTAIKLGEIATEAGLPHGVVNVLVGAGGEVGPALCSDPRVDMVSFTGGTRTGREVMKAASGETKKLVMELGGKSAAIVLGDADVGSAVMGTLTSAFLNQGQMCTAMSRILVDRKIAGEFIGMFIEKAGKIKLGNGLDPETQMGPLASREHRESVARYVEKGRDEGAEVLCGGGIPARDGLERGLFFEPTVFGQVRPEMTIFQEEIFGPVVCVSEFSSEEEAVELDNNSRFGLACSIWSSDPARARALSLRIDAGTIWINTYGMFYNEAPYGGFKRSGFGKELGREGFLEYTRLKHVNLDPSG